MEILARWREAGKWWEQEPETEWVRFLDERGILREISFERENDGTTSKRRANDGSRGIGHTVDYDVLRLEYRQALRNVEEWARTQVKSYPVAALHGLSALSFGRSTMMPEHFAAFAKMRGYRAAAITDRFSLSGVVDFCKTAQVMGIKPIIGATLEITDGGSIVVLSKNKKGYAALSRLITHCHLQSERMLTAFDIDAYDGSTEGLVCLTGGYSGPVDRALIKKDDHLARRQLRRLQRVFSEVYIELEQSAAPWSISLDCALRKLANDAGLNVIAGGPATHACREDFAAQDALVCADTLCTVEEIIGRKESLD